ncbi:hypothetical protein [uncultured Alistipes sp.]|jgi:lipoprotein|uniref:hypothetical protein n=1 Tax=uncultured Alistipes sp. TaxID=538949 RepID=UPI0025CD99B2|nr:hypothetical protein [uncultured Alistipes sp.]
MKKYLTLATTLLLFAACDKKNEPAEIKYETVGRVDQIAISNVGTAYSEISEVAFVARFHGFGRPYGSTINAAGEDTRVMLKVPFDSENTKLILPQNPPQELLGSIVTDFPAGFAISDPEASTIVDVEIACNISESNKFSEFLYLTFSSGRRSFQLEYIYCDRLVTVTGSGKDWWGSPATYDLNLVKGWNRVVEKTEYIGNVKHRTVTHMMPEAMMWKQDRWIGGRSE